MANKLLVIAGPPFTHCKKIADGINDLNHKGIETNLVDVCRLSESWCINEPCWKEKLPGGKHIEICNRHELKEFIKANVSRKTICLFLFLPIRSNRYIWKEFYKSRPRVGMIIPGSRPWDDAVDETSPAGIMRNKFITILYTKITSCLKPKIDLWILSGEKSVEQYRRFFNMADSAKIAWAHNFDYETYLEESQNNRLTGAVGKKTAVYIDQAFTTHPDRYLNQLGDYVTASKYSRKINELFKEIVNQLGMRCVVLGHPKGEKKNIEEMYSPNEVEFGKLYERIRKSDLVIAHSSTALYLAVLLKKRILLITTDELIKSKLYPLSEGFRKELNIPVVNIDHDYNICSIYDQTVIKAETHDTFVRNYIKVDLNDKRSIWDVIESEARLMLG